jgi:hypothetical protein
MTYSSGGLIQAADYNGFASRINTIWGVGSGSSGYGQSTTLNSSIAGSSTVNIASTEWSSAISRINSMKGHQSAASYSPTAPTSGGVITYLSDFNTALSAIETNKNVFAANGTDSTTNIDLATGWYTSSQRIAAITFASGDAARYFFNAGGQIRVSFSLTGGDNAKSTDWANLCTNVGTMVISANSFARVGGAGAAPTTNNTAVGYYALTQSYQTLFQQYSNGSSGAYYNSNYIQFLAQTNANNVSGNGDKGSVIYVYGYFADAAVDSDWTQLSGAPDYVDEVHGTLRMTTTIRPPSTSYLSATWGTPTVTTNTNTANGQSAGTAAATRSFTNNYTTSPWNLDTNGNYNIGGSIGRYDFRYLVPQYDFKAFVHMWGAGGGGGAYNNGYYPSGGPGGYSYGLVQFKAGYTYYYVIGEQGAPNQGSDYYPSPWGGRGIRGGSAGGLTALYINTNGFGSFVMCAGGGGGGGNNYGKQGSSGEAGGAGGGGGDSGYSAGVWPFGRTPSGGSQTGGGLSSTGGIGGAHDGGWNGYPFHGGASGGLGGGGGSGYWGGGGGGYANNWDCSGAGGSGYINATHVSGGATQTSTGGTYGGYYRQPQGYASPYWGSAGLGGYHNDAGSAGRLVIL